MEEAGVMSMFLCIIVVMFAGCLPEPSRPTRAPDEKTSADSRPPKTRPEKADVYTRCCEYHHGFLKRLQMVENPHVLQFVANAKVGVETDCCAAHRTFWKQIEEEPGIYIYPCATCVLDLWCRERRGGDVRADQSPYCNNMCGPTPYEGLAEMLEGKKVQ